MRSFTFAGAIFLACAITAGAQVLPAGISTGADGALTVPYGTAVVVQLPESGVLNYTTIDVAQYGTLTFKKNSQNTPVMLLANGDVTVIGTIDVSSGATNQHGDYDCSAGGPGGFDGARLAGQSGQGPAGGPAGTDNRARWVGQLTLVPLIGGSGGGAGTWNKGCGGGGSIGIASSGKITMGGVIRANAVPQQSYGWICVGGAGGSIRLVANEIVANGGAFYADGARAEAEGLPGNPGLIRLEAPAEKLTYAGAYFSPPAGFFAVNPTLSAGPAPVLTIASIGGFPVPATAGQKLDVADLVLPRQLADPVAVVVTASNIPVGTPITAAFGAGSGTITPGALAGTLESSTATLQISGMARDGSISFLYVTAVFSVPGGGGAANPPGPDHVTDVRMRAELGRPAAYAFLRADGTEIDPARLPKAFLSYFSR